MFRISVLFVGTLLVSASFALASDGSADERFKAKFGRSSPSVEARRPAATHSALQVEGDCHEICCRHRNQASTPADMPLSYSNVWAQAKLGRAIGASPDTHPATTAAHPACCGKPAPRQTATIALDQRSPSEYTR